jgi:hypothetical protein
MNYRVNYYLAQADGVHAFFFKTVFCGNLGERAIFGIKAINNPLRCGDSAAIAILMGFKQINLVRRSASGDMRGLRFSCTGWLRSRLYFPPDRKTEAGAPAEEKDRDSFLGACRALLARNLLSKKNGTFQKNS